VVRWEGARHCPVGDVEGASSVARS
jgi:hypothetical protein